MKDIKIRQSYSVRVLDVDKLSASLKLGARVATAKYLFFTDDDAHISAVEIHDLRQKLRQSLDIIVAKRWDVERKWTTQPTIYSLPSYFIEWNIIIKRKLFSEIGGFDEIGVGSNHPAQSGEAFILIVKSMRCHRARIEYLSSMEIQHPRLDINLRSDKARGYLCGLGYSIGFSLNYLSVNQKVYWCTRLVVAFSKRACMEIFEQKNQHRQFNFNTLQIFLGFFWVCVRQEVKTRKIGIDVSYWYPKVIVALEL